MQKINKNKAIKMGFNFRNKSTYAVYSIQENNIFYNLDFDKTKCGFIYLLKE